ncbi:hypothetical protein QBC39DRAFT_379844 [Podospora conica]|nr:hypothetical protein QBC39DRAFT_379844 [Schizothecium conicum]
MRLDTAIVLLVTAVRMSISNIVESSISQGAWNWVAETAQRRRRRRGAAVFSDFGMFDAASRGFMGSIKFLLKMKFKHAASLGAAIVVVTHFFETFSQQMISYEQRPLEIANGSHPAPAPPRSEIWDAYLPRGSLGNLAPVLSTKAAVYSGIISTEIPMIRASCETANCSWPVIPTLAACGECATIPVSTRCNDTTEVCTYSTSDSNWIDTPKDAEGYSSFRVSPSNGTVYPLSNTSRAYLSVFDMLLLDRAIDADLEIVANQCALWFCIQAYSIQVDEGVQNQIVVGNWSTTSLKHGSTGSHGAEYVFVDVPHLKLNVDNTTRYSITHEAMMALRVFMADITSGTVYADLASIRASSDWAEAMWNSSSDTTSDWITRLAGTLTNDIRQNGQLSGGVRGSARSYEGSATQLAPYLHVSWLWLIYPGVVIVVAIYLLLHTIIASARDGVSVWKSAALPMLFIRVDDDIHERVRDGMDVPDGLDERIGDMQVALYRGEGGQWGFRTPSVDEA